MKAFSLKKMLGLLAIGGAVAYARSKKIDVLGMLGLKKDATPADDRAGAATSEPATTASGFANAGATSRGYAGETRSGYSGGLSPSNNNSNGTRRS